jgi:hypothetical protein
MSTRPTCGICGEPMPVGEEMFVYHGYSGPCPKPPIGKQTPPPPVLTSGDVIALRKLSAEMHAQIGVELGVDTYTASAIAHTLQRYARQLDTLLDRSSGRGQQDPIRISGAGDNESEGQSVQRPTDGDNVEREGQ